MPRGRKKKTEDVVTSETRPKLSIITTFYNAEAYIYTAISTVNQQVHGNYDFEYVLVDDKSEDGSREIVENFIKKEVDKKVKKCWKIIEPEKNLGCGGARRFGIEHSTGDYLMFLDADDYYMKIDFCQRAMDTIISTQSDIVEYGIVYNNANGTRQVSQAPQQVTIENNKESALLALFRDNLIKFNVWSKIYKRSLTNSFTYSDSRTFEDVRTIPMWVYNANKITIMPSCEINYRAAANSIIREDNIKTRIGTITAITELFPLYQNYPQVLKAMYQRSMIDFQVVLENHNSRDLGFNEMAKLNKVQLSYIFPNEYKEYTYTLDDTLDDNLKPRDSEKLVLDMGKIKFDKSKTPTPID